MNTNFYYGDLVRLAAIDPEESAAAVSRFSRDSEYSRLLDSYPCRLFTKEGTKKWIEKDLEKENVFEYNPRAIRAYEKLGFQHEGRVRKYLNREGRRWDLVYMGITKEEWLSPKISHQNL